MKIILILGLGLILVGCATPTATKARTPGVYLGDKPDFNQMKSFKRLVKTVPGSPEFEKARIEYLFERLSKTKYNFIRNGEVYSNARAVIHLRWKLLRFQKDVKTAENFVDRIAFGSRISGESYLIKTSENQYYLLRWILYNELELLDTEFIKYQEELKKSLQEVKKEKEELIQQAGESHVKEISPKAEILNHP